MMLILEPVLATKCVHEHAERLCLMELCCTLFEEVVFSVILAGSHKLFDYAGLLELVVDRFGSVTINSQPMSSSSNRVGFGD